MIRPTTRLIKTCFALSFIWLVVGLSQFYLPKIGPLLGFLCLAITITLCLFAVVDWFVSRPLTYFPITRTVAHTLPVGRKNHVVLTLNNPRHYPLKVTLHDHVPESLTMTQASPSAIVQPQQQIEVCYEILPTKRGDAHFPKIDIAAISRMGFWELKRTKSLPQTIKVYPDFSAIAQLASLEHDQQSAQIGLHLQQRRGEGIEFRQLREFRRGDSLRRVDWKASSRMRKLIARDYQDERDQEIIFLLDCGRRMHSRDSSLSHFDHSLNATLLLTYVALSKGDKVGLMTFAGHDLWHPPRGGSAALPDLIRQTYGLHSSLANPDYLDSVSNLLSRQKRRALIVILSNYYSEDSEDLLAAVTLLRKKHLVITASLRPAYAEQQINQPVTDFQDALRYSGANQFLLERDYVTNALRAIGVYIIDSTPQRLAVELVNQYLSMKRSGLC